ncbi:hypothetical protein BRADI_1g30283v3 [Brachypodium distachyon]|uniref:Uncharacterized protein n=1 Tax=Brachypodium distachyon TaxID=15368 RepID=A0A2K2DM14_BRADI|nr:hypothetical protein BRADI_1g30283v3 [Brachypodium distachyon]
MIDGGKPTDFNKGRDIELDMPTPLCHPCAFWRIKPVFIQKIPLTIYSPTKNKKNTQELNVISIETVFFVSLDYSEFLFPSFVPRL